MNTSKNNINALEEKAFFQLKPLLEDYLNYLTSVYYLAFDSHNLFHEKLYNTLNDYTRSLLIVLMRITDFLRSILLLLTHGYPEQAGSLTASIFELAHTLLFFSNDPKAANIWISSKSIKEQMPSLIGLNTWFEVVKSNCQINGLQEDYEYQVYKQLCWMKHSLPSLQGFTFSKDKKDFKTRTGPYTDDQSIRFAKFSTVHAGRLTELAIALLLKILPNDECLKQLHSIKSIREKLIQKAMKEYGTDNPFSN